MKTYSDSTLMRMTKTELIDQLRCAQHNQAVWEETVKQQAENVKDFEPVTHCKDCKYHRLYSTGNIYCVHSEGLSSQGPDAFCSYGEPMTGGGDCIALD